eukprot:scaffold86659_cov40-Cyclotella_meneghiniana.AAC.2
MEKLSINGLIILIQESLLEYFQQPQIRLKHTLALAGRSPLVHTNSKIIPLLHKTPGAVAGRSRADTEEKARRGSGQKQTFYGTAGEINVSLW